MKNFIFSFFFLLCAVCTAQSFNNVPLDSLFQQLELHERFMGNISIAHDGKTIYQNAAGFTDVENSIAASTQSKYRIGSISKMFTAALTLMAVEEDKISLETTLDNYFPQVKNAEQISIRNLLNHSSGIFNFTNDPNYFTYHTEAKTEADMLDILTIKEPAFDPGTEHDYSNSNYVLLSYILEKVYGTSYSDLLESKIVKPLKLENTHYGKATDIANNESYSYKYLGKWEKEAETDLSIPEGAGAIISTASDLNQFITGLFEGKLISKESLAQMQTITEGYGLGLFKFPYGEKSGYGHTGGIDGFQSISSYFPNEKLALTIVSNGTVYELNNITLAALDTYFGKEFKMPNFETVELTAAELDSYLGIYGSAQIPPKITITKNGTTLMAQATGQGAFPLDAKGDHRFVFEPAGVEIIFNPNDGTMVLNQGGGSFKFTKE